ncbi:MAG: phosphoribosylformylglycinamidine cyclo-ligase [Nitrospinota bacterium]
MNPPAGPRPDRAALTYRQAGVDIGAAEALVPRLRSLAVATRRPEVEGEIGGFGGCFRIPRGYRNPLLVSGMDGVGTKLDLLIQTGRHRVAGRDLVAMCVNDVLTQGAQPLFFLDYIATGKLEPPVVEEVVAGAAAACAECGCALLGGETAEMPGFYPEGRYDLAGCAVGIVEEEALLDGRAIRPGDVLLGLASSGPHSNGFSLVRRILEKEGLSLEQPLPGGRGQPLADALLAPTRLYVRAVSEILKETTVGGIAHVTGGGIARNLERILPQSCRAVVEYASWPVLPVFDFLQRAGSVPPEEMEAVFNLGVGLIVVVSPGEAGGTIETLRRAGAQVYRIGRVEECPPGGDRVILERRGR